MSAPHREMVWRRVAGAVDDAAAARRFAHCAQLIIEAEAEGLIDYLTCPACRALVPIPADASWPDTCPRCGRCV